MGTAATVLTTALSCGIGLWTLEKAYGWLKRRRDEKREEMRLLAYLCGLPDEMKAVLIEYQVNGTHTQRGNPSHPPTRQLLRDRALILGGGGGTRDAVNSYLTVRPELWTVMETRWYVADPKISEIVMWLTREQEFEKSPEP